MDNPKQSVYRVLFVYFYLLGPVNGSFWVYMVYVEDVRRSRV